jgi:hypothetical protein
LLLNLLWMKLSVYPQIKREEELAAYAHGQEISK